MRGHPDLLRERLDRRAGAAPDCGRRRPGRCAAPAASTCSRGRRPAGTPPSSREYGCSHSPSTEDAVCGALRSGLSSTGHSPDPTRSISALIAIIAATNRSSSTRSSDSVGSTMSVPATGKRHRRRVEAVVDQPLGHVVHGDSGRRGDRAQIEDAFVGDEPVGAGVEHREVLVEPAGDVVRGQDRRSGGGGQPVTAHQPDVGPADRQDRSGAPRRRRDGTGARRRTGQWLQRVVGQVGRQVLTHTDRAHSRTAAAVRDAERLVQVQVRDVGAELARGGPARPSR